MKRISLFKFALLSTIMVFLAVACSGGKTTGNEKEGEHEGVVVSPGTAAVEALEALEKVEGDSLKFVCSCEHHCATKEECEKSCGPECSKGK
jgi:hypothetical protein